MVVYNLTIKHFLFPQLLVFFYIFMITTFFSLLTPCTSAISFNFSNFTGCFNSGITCERSAAVENHAIQLTGAKDTGKSKGRVTYYKPMHLWDKASNNVTNFTTHFSFSINSQNQTTYADGLAFFLAPENSTVPTTTRGSSLGLASMEQDLNTTDNHFVAVEFDIYRNPEWDPPDFQEHVGIDINSMQSISPVSWLSNISIREGKINEAWISHNSSSHNFSVVFTGFGENGTVMQHYSQQVDLSESLPERVIFGFSAATELWSAIHTIYSWDFSSSLEIENSTASHKKSNTFVWLALGFSVGGFALVVVGLFLFVLWKRNRRDKEDDRALDEEFKREIGPRRFSYDELARATNNFNNKEKLGQGGFGEVYRGYLKDLDSIVAVKRVSEGSRQGIREYESEVKIISKLRHRNLVQLIGWCHERSRGQLLLVYDFMSNGSLDLHLFKEDTLLIWDVRYKVVQHLASALLYLHEGWESCVLHRDIKSSNIMLDSNFNAKLGDFGLARLVDHAKESRITDLVGSKGYIDPRCVTTRKASKESDIYSFGIVALEVACGRKPVNHNAPEDQVVMLDWVKVLHGRGEVLTAVDQRLRGRFDE